MVTGDDADINTANAPGPGYADEVKQAAEAGTNIVSGI